ncbi:ectoine/hydroxyectoine ABC transporter permease subunit EhuD [Acidihalobacter ferrooxydans]|uniref:Ectoine/hydroxyectoine ABC transporter permease subunit EhuD n=1 Tax=Acidihalobacter ferrooxydans TaxID=1765967 RepID=A0A1P8UG28_9GAMM|nr:ectoine/hydroxyectoine ABC transporter permease subunit EhuD [Acidihalobacter ferrooxydans]APZ42786.1 ectoine/hydroxyectoine ABC transporter permease subunit EhuD [Acidihalobacter ferrooxydans]
MLFGIHWDTSGSTLTFALSILPILLIGLKVTIEATIFGFLLALSVGLLLAILRSSRLRVVSWPIWFVIEFLRDTPLLVQLFFLFYVLPMYGISLPALMIGIIGLGLQYSAYCAEVYRAGIEAIDHGQWEAAHALDLSKLTIYVDIVLPQAIPRIIPALGTYLVAMIKDAPLLSAITVLDMMAASTIIGDQTYNYIVPLTMVGGLFLVSTLVASYLVNRLDRALPKTGIPMK